MTYNHFFCAQTSIINELKRQNKDGVGGIGENNPIEFTVNMPVIVNLFDDKDLYGFAACGNGYITINGNHFDIVNSWFIYLFDNYRKITKAEIFYQQHNGNKIVADKIFKQFKADKLFTVIDGPIEIESEISYDFPHDEDKESESLARILLSPNIDPSDNSYTESIF